MCLAPGVPEHPRWAGGLALGIVLAVTLAAASGCAHGRPDSAAVDRGSPSPSPLVDVAPVTTVTDGDTIRVLYQGRDEPVRLIGIDTPEVPWYGGEAECYGQEAGLYARGRLSGRSVGLAFDGDRRDRFERMLAYVYVDDELFNLTLVRRGFARADPVAPNTSRAEQFGVAEREAREAGLGLWGACSST